MEKVRGGITRPTRFGMVAEVAVCEGCTAVGLRSTSLLLRTDGHGDDEDKVSTPAATFWAVPGDICVKLAGRSARSIGGGCTVTSKLGEYGADASTTPVAPVSDSRDGEGLSRVERGVERGRSPPHSSAAETTALRGKGRLPLALMGGGGVGANAVSAASTGLDMIGYTNTQKMKVMRRSRG
jgi:hypothetical protein